MDLVTTTVLSAGAAVITGSAVVVRVPAAARSVQVTGVATAAVAGVAGPEDVVTVDAEDAGAVVVVAGQVLAVAAGVAVGVVAAVVDGVAEAAVVGIKWLRFVTSPHAQRLRLGIPIAVTHKFIECEKNSQAVICLLLGLSAASRINSNKRRNGRSWRMFLFSMQCCIQIMHFAFCHFAFVFV